MTQAREAYEAWHAALDVDAAADAPWHRLVTAHLPPLAGKRVLEVACGRGGFAAQLCALGAALVVGADFSRTAIAKAERHRVAMRALTLRLGVADAAALPWTDEAFDVVVSCETVEHVPHPIATIREMARVLRRGGVLVLTTPNYLGLMGAYRAYRAATGRPYTEEGQPVNTLAVLPRTVHWIRAAGLHIEAVDGIGHYVPIPGRAPVALPFLDGGCRPLRWFALHSLVVARRHKAAT